VTRGTRSNARQAQKQFLKDAIQWLERYPCTQEHTETFYDEADEVELADKLAAFLTAYLNDMPNEA